MALAQVVDFTAAVQRRARKAEPLSSKAEVAEHFRVSERTISRWMLAGMPFEKPFERGSVRFRLGACDDWFRERR